MVKKILITGADGFIGKNLHLHLAERHDFEVIHFTRRQSVAELPDLLHGVDYVFHLAGVNRPQDAAEFARGNALLTEALCRAVVANFRNTGKRVPIVYTSSTQAEDDNPYGQSKLAAEKALFQIAISEAVPVNVVRLPNVFGKWCRPHYNSAVATFCHQIARGEEVQINDPTAKISLVYIDDVCSYFIKLLDGPVSEIDSADFSIVCPQYTTTVGALVQHIQSFRESRPLLTIDRVGEGWLRALYSTYLSYLPAELFCYPVTQHNDHRGTFVEMLKTPDCGQISYFTANVGVTRGGHYHHTKTEKFLVIKGHARFRFRHMVTGQSHELVTNGEKAEIVETVPGWTHDITNMGKVELVVILWANEVFNRERPDTVSSTL